MLEKTIKTVLNKKINNWVASIDDVEVRDIIKGNTVITGGCFVSLLNNEEPKDFDVYFQSREAAIRVGNYYIDKFIKSHPDTVAFLVTPEDITVHEDGVSIDNPLIAKKIDGNWIKISRNEDGIVYTCGEQPISSDVFHNLINIQSGRVKLMIPSVGVASERVLDDVVDNDDPAEFDYSDLEKGMYRPVFLSSNAITLSDKIQIILRFYGNPEKIHQTFDFVHTKAYFTSWNNNLKITSKVYEAILNKTLIYDGSLYPICSMLRVRKFLARGWTINAGQIIKMCLQIGELDLTVIATLEDQLIGVDSLYFMRLINMFREAKLKNSSIELDSTYIISLINKVF